MMKIIRTTHDDKYTQFTLGDLIRAIEKYDIPNDDGSYKEVVFDFGSTAPSGIHSWRGDYSELAIDYKDEHEITSDKFLAMLTDAVGKTFEGWKGGNYFMFLDTPLWVAHRNIAGETGIVGVVDGFNIVIQTAHITY